MSDKEKAEFTKDIEVALVKKWWPLAVAFFGAILFAITTTWWAAHNIATTSDTDKIAVKVDTLTKRVEDIKRAYVPVIVENTQHKAIYHSIDSVGSILARIQHGPLTSWRDKYGNTHFKTND